MLDLLLKNENTWRLQNSKSDQPEDLIQKILGAQHVWQKYPLTIFSHFND